MIYVYTMWDFWNGYWTQDTSENKEKIDDSDSWYFMDEQTYNEQASSIPNSGNLAEF